jgi:DNA anti-recombination protein RmuC
MRQIAFDTLKFSEKLILSGIPEKQAKAQVEALADVMQVNLDGLSTKHDLQDTETRLESKIQLLDIKIDHVHHDLDAKICSLDVKIDRVHHELDTKIDRVHHELDTKIDRVHHELDTKIDHVHQDLRTQIDTSRTEFNGKFTLLQWMLGFLVAGVIGLITGMAGLVIKLIF